MASRKEEILIIGAGVSGISAALKLLENGFENVTILEAENRIGGRIESIRFGSGFIDLGAQWCSGQKGNSVHELCHTDFNFGTTGLLRETPITLTSKGEKIDDEKITKLENLCEEIMSDTCKMKLSDKSLGEYLEEKYFEALKDPRYNDIEKELQNMYLSYWHREINSLYSSPNWYDISIKMHLLSKLCDGDQYLTWKQHGYMTLFDIMMKKYSNSFKLKNKILLNKKVTKINWNSNRVMIETSDKSIYSCDHVIVTVSLGVLQRYHKTLFTPMLPYYKIKAIENMKFGTLGKVFLEFEEPFWNNDFAMYLFLWTQEDLNQIIGTDKEWLINAIGFLRVDGQPNLFETLLSGNKMYEFETYSEEKITSDCMWMLEKFFKRKLPRPSTIRKTKWLTRENFYGAYSYMSSAENKISPDDLAEPILSKDDEPIMLFAGEATDTVHQGYVHGAIDSGKKAAQCLIEYYSYAKNCSKL